MTSFERQIRTAVYQSFVETSRPPTVAKLREKLAKREGNVRQALESLAQQHILVLRPDGEVQMAMPFSSVSTLFRVTADGQSWDANCAWDAFGIAAVLDRDIVIHTVCADCNDRATISAGPHKKPSLEGVVHFLVPAAKWWNDIGFT